MVSPDRAKTGVSQQCGTHARHETEEASQDVSRGLIWYREMTDRHGGSYVLMGGVHHGSIWPGASTRAVPLQGEHELKKRGPLAESLLRRSRLLARINDVDGVVVIEAPAGFGKTVLLRQVVEASDGLLVRDEMTRSDITAQLAPAAPDSVVVAIDHASTRVADVLKIAEHPAVGRLVIADRLMAPEIQALSETYETCELTADDLRFDRNEMGELAEQLAPVSGIHPPKDGPPDVAERVAAVLGSASEGWPLAVQWMLRRAFTSGDPLSAATEMSYPGPDADAFVDEYLAGLDDSLRDAVEALAHFDAFTGACVNPFVGTNGASYARRAGMPLLVGDRNWHRLPSPISRPLRARSTLDPSTARLLAPILIATGGILAGVRTLMRSGFVSDARQQLEGAEAIRLDELDQQGLMDIVATLRAEQDSPQLALVEARAHRRLGNHPASDACLDACLAMGASGWADDPANAEVLLAARIDRLFSNAFDPGVEVDSQISDLRSQISDDMEKTHELRLDEIDALVRAQSSDPAVVHQACEDVLAVATRWQNLGETGHAAVAIRKISATGLCHLGRYHDAIESLKIAHDLSWDRLRDRTLTLSLSCRMRALAGEVETVASSIRELESLAGAVKVSWLEGYRRWTEMIVASRQGDAKRVAESARKAEHAIGSLLDHETGVLFRSEAATAFAEVGLFDEAEEQLAHVGERAGYGDVEFGLASAVVAARQGRREETTAILAVLNDSGRLPPPRAWRATFEASIAADLAGEREAATRLRSLALAEAERYGHERLAAHLLQNAPTLGARSVSGPALRIKVFGGFSVELDGEPVELPDGHVMVLLKLLAVSDSAVPAEVVFDVLWPEASTDLARRRIKNIVSRLRGLIGADHLIRSNEALQLASDVWVDLREFNRHVRTALASESDVEVARAHLTEALDLYQGELLPVDVYDDWAADVRHVARARTLTVLDTIFDLDQRLRPSAAWLFDVLLRVDAYDDARLLVITRQALAEGHSAVAKAALERALTAAQSLGVSLDEEIQDLRFLLKTA